MFNLFHNREGLFLFKKKKKANIGFYFKLLVALINEPFNGFPIEKHAKIGFPFAI